MFKFDSISMVKNCNKSQSVNEKECVVEFDEPVSQNEPLNNAEFLENLKTTIKGNRERFSIINKQGLNEKYSVEIHDSVSELDEQANNVVAIFQMSVQNNCIRLKPMDILNTGKPDLDMVNRKRKESNGNRSSEGQSKNNINVICLEDSEQSSMSLREMQKTLQELAEMSEENVTPSPIKNIKSDLSARSTKSAFAKPNETTFKFPNNSNLKSEVKSEPQIIITKADLNDLIQLTGKDDGVNSISKINIVNNNINPVESEAQNLSIKDLSSANIKPARSDITPPSNILNMPLINIKPVESEAQNLPIKDFSSTNIKPVEYNIAQPSDILITPQINIKPARSNITTPSNIQNEPRLSFIDQPEKIGMAQENLPPIIKPSYDENEKAEYNYPPAKEDKVLSAILEAKLAEEQNIPTESAKGIDLVKALMPEIQTPIEQESSVPILIANDATEQMVEPSDIPVYTTENEIANMINDIAKEQIDEQNKPANEISRRSTQYIKNDSENLIIHITLPEKSEFEVILNRVEPKRNPIRIANSNETIKSQTPNLLDFLNIKETGKPDVNTDSNIAETTSNANSSVKETTSNTNSSVKETTSNTNSSVKETTSNTNSSVKETNSTYSSVKEAIDKNDKPSEGQVKKMIEFYETLHDI